MFKIQSKIFSSYPERRSKRNWSNNLPLFALLSTAIVFGQSFVQAHAADCTNVESKGGQCVRTVSEVEGVIGGLRSSGLAPQEILLVFDIDNTLLTAKQDLGRDGWWEWQSELIDGKQVGDYFDAPVGTDIGQLIDIQYLLYNLGDMRPSEKNLPATVRALQDAGHPMIALTARGPAASNDTFRELKEQGYLFRTALPCGRGLCGDGGEISRQQIAQLLQHNEPKTESIKTVLTKGTRDIFYDEGVMMVSGQDKGVMLQLLLDQSAQGGVKAIVFVDDGEKNILKMLAAFSQSDKRLQVKSLRYDAMLADKEAFLQSKSRQKKASEDWEKIRSTLCTVIPTNDDRAFCKTFRIASWNVLRGTVEEIEKRGQEGAFEQAKKVLRPDILIVQELSSFAAARRLAYHMGMRDAEIAVSNTSEDTNKWFAAHEVGVISRVPVLSIDEFEFRNPEANEKQKKKAAGPFYVNMRTGIVEIRRVNETGYAPVKTLWEKIPLEERKSIGPVRGFLRVQLENKLVVYAVHLKSQRVGHCGWPGSDIEDAKNLQSRLQNTPDFASQSEAFERILQHVWDKYEEAGKTAPAWNARLANARKRELVAAGIAEQAAKDVAAGLTVLVGGDFNVSHSEPCKSGTNIFEDTPLDINCTSKVLTADQCTPGDGYDDTHAILRSNSFADVEMRSLGDNIGRTHVSKYDSERYDGPIDYLYVAGPAAANFSQARKMGEAVRNGTKPFVFGSDHHPVLTILRK